MFASSYLCGNYECDFAILSRAPGRREWVTICDERTTRNQQLLLLPQRDGRWRRIQGQEVFRWVPHPDYPGLVTCERTGIGSDEVP